MSRPRLALIHTVPTLVDAFAELAIETLGDAASVVHMVDESLLADTIAAGALSPAVSRRVARQVFGAEDAGASAILVTCSSVGPAVEATRPFCSVPVLRVDEPMIDRALDRGTAIAAIGTLATTLEPTAELIRRRAAERSQRVAVRSYLCEGAFEALRAGDLDEHDARVRAGLREVLANADVVVLAQASMARVADQLGALDVLTSPRLSMERAAQMVLETRD
jgi:Asp/Glu/hydantoin racemase